MTVAHAGSAVTAPLPPHGMFLCRDTFAAGASLYGVADMELLAKETHKFESR